MSSYRLPMQFRHCKALKFEYTGEYDLCCGCYSVRQMPFHYCPQAIAMDIYLNDHLQHCDLFFTAFGLCQCPVEDSGVLAFIRTNQLSVKSASDPLSTITNIISPCSPHQYSFYFRKIEIRGDLFYP